jgi:hypothetical protein
LRIAALLQHNRAQAQFSSAVGRGQSGKAAANNDKIV